MSKFVNWTKQNTFERNDCIQNHSKQHNTPIQTCSELTFHQILKPTYIIWAKMHVVNIHRCIACYYWMQRQRNAYTLLLLSIQFQFYQHLPYVARWQLKGDNKLIVSAQHVHSLLAPICFSDGDRFGLVTY